MRRALNLIAGVPAALIVIAFAVANRDWTRVSFDPFSRTEPFAYADMPLWALLFCGIFLGLISGWIGCWFAQAKWRRAAREARQEARRANEELAALRRNAPATTAQTRLNQPQGLDPF